MPWFGQELFEQAEANGGLDAQGVPRCARRVPQGRRATTGIDRVLKAHRLDALVAPTGGPAWLTDPVNGDHFGGELLVAGGGGGLSAPHGPGRASSAACRSASRSSARAWSEARLLALGHAYERRSARTAGRRRSRAEPRPTEHRGVALKRTKPAEAGFAVWLLPSAGGGGARRSRRAPPPSVSTPKCWVPGSPRPAGSGCRCSFRRSCARLSCRSSASTGSRRA